jgi:hypothetical protein
VAWPLRRAGRQPDREPSQHTARNALVAAALLLGALVLLAQGWGDRWAVKPPMDRYIRLGPREGPAMLERDLTAAYPAGSGIGPLFDHLARHGFACDTAARGAECRFRATWEDRQLATMLVTVTHDGVLLAGIAARMTIGPF